MKFCAALAVAVLAAAAPAAAQPLPPIETWPVAAANRQQFRTAEVQPDRSVVLKVAAPEATGVEARLGGKGHAMSRDDKGVWTATIPPLAPQIYTFSFRIAGATVNSGEVEVRGTSPLDHDWQDVPHGSVAIAPYFSRALGRPVHLRVYLPPQYYSEPKRKFPVFYLFNSQDPDAWTGIGRANLILDNLIAQRRAAPMIVVMPDNRITADGLETSAPTVASMERQLPQEIFPLIEGRYRGLSGRLNRAIAGLSFGGGTAFGVGMRHLDWFGYVGEFGSGTFGGLANPTSGPNAGYVSYLVPYDGEKIAPGMHARLLAPATRPRLFYMSVGETDPRRVFQEAAFKDFQRRGIEPVFTTFPGGHDFIYFRAGMADFATRLFKR